MLLSAEAVCLARRVRVCPLGEGSAVYVRDLTIAEHRRIDELPRDARPAALAALSVCDAEGRPLFGDAAEAAEYIDGHQLAALCRFLSAEADAIAEEGSAEKNS
jgi:hypothetical protein